jgi:hypothetical protein
MDVYAIVTEKIINMLEQGVVPWRRPWISTNPVSPGLIVVEYALGPLRVEALIGAEAQNLAHSD